MIKKLMDKVRSFTILLCFLVFVGMNDMFSILYCGEVSTTSRLFSVFWALIFCGILALLPTLAKRIVMITLISLFAFLCLVHAAMYNLFGNFFSFSDLLYTGDGMAFFSFSYIKIRKLLWITVIASITASVILAFNLKKKKYNWYQAIIGIVLLIIGISGIYTQHNKIMSGLNTVIAWDTAGQKENDADIYQNMTNKNYVMSMTGIYQYLYRSFVVTTGLENRLSNREMYKELDEYFAQYEAAEHEINEMTGVLKGKNVFFVMLESIDTWMITEEYMPNLYQLQQESVNFANHYSPLYISAGTFNTEFIANTSILPPTSGIDNKVYKDNYFPTSLANCFNAAGYISNSFHSSNPIIYNRGAIHENLGYTKYHNWVDMNMEDYMLDSQMINGYSKMTAEEPFFSFVITYSGHGPYTEELQNISENHMETARELVSVNPIDASENDKEELVHAIAHAMETDVFVGALLNELKQDELLEDTVLVFFTDHYAKYMTNHELLLEIKGVENSDFLCNTPFFVYSTALEAQEVQTISSTADIAPTLVNMFDLEASYAYYTGVDVFSDKDHYVIFQGNGWYDGEIYYTPNYDGEMTEMIRERNREVSEKQRISEFILKSDYFSYLKENKQ